MNCGIVVTSGSRDGGEVVNRGFTVSTSHAGTFSRGYCYYVGYYVIVFKSLSVFFKAVLLAFAQ